MQECGAIAVDSSGNDISSSIIAVDVTPCASNAQCPACDITFAAAGLCLPGPYLYLYRYEHALLPVSLPHTFLGQMGAYQLPLTPTQGAAVPFLSAAAC